MSVGSRARASRRWSTAWALALALVLLIWTLMPLYNMVLVAVQQKE